MQSIESTSKESQVEMQANRLTSCPTQKSNLRPRTITAAAMMAQNTMLDACLRPRRFELLAHCIHTVSRRSRHHVVVYQYPSTGTCVSGILALIT